MCITDTEDSHSIDTVLVMKDVSHVTLKTYILQIRYT